MKLSERIEAAEAGSRELDREIAKSQGWHRVEPRFTKNKHGAWIAPEDFTGVYSDGSPILDSLHGTTMHRDVPIFTTSLDAAMSLVPEGWQVTIDCMPEMREPPSCEVECWSIGKDHRDTMRRIGRAATPALALCAAALKARGL